MKPTHFSSNSKLVSLGVVALIVAAVFAAWSNSLSAPFVFDDTSSIVENQSIRRLGSFSWLIPPSTAGETVSGRPVLNFTFAVNYAIGGLNPRGYHLVDLLLHAAAALALFGIVRRTTGRANRPGEPKSGARVGGTPCPAAAEPRPSWWPAFAAALLWALHPLQTAAVSYTVQRAEVLAGLFLLLTLYCFIRGLEAGAPSRWFSLSVASCLLGMGTKETMAVAPLLVLLYDRTFVAGTFRAAWQARGRLHAALMSTWLLLVILVATNHSRGGSAGLSAAISPAAYFFTQCDAIVRYLTLVVWPDPLVFDYGTAVVVGFGAVWWQLLLLVVAGAATIWALVRNKPLGFVGACFFLLLAPSSSFIPVATQTIAEHRMYLPLAAVIAAVGLGLGALKVPARGVGVFAVVVALAFGAVTFSRNQVYRSEITLWQDTVAQRPDNPRAHHNLATAYVRIGELDQAVIEYQRAVALRPEHAFAHFGLGTIRFARGQWADAATNFQAALAADPHYTAARLSLAQALVKLGRTDEAIAQYQAALADEPAAETCFVLGNLLAKQQRFAEAMKAYADALNLDASHVQARANLANCQLMLGRFDDAISNYEVALRVRPGDAALQRNLEIAREMQAQRAAGRK